jgi:SAM-dependent methyltransferase
MYTDLADWWPLLSAPSEYVEEAGFYAEQLIESTEGPVRNVLELGSGGGNNASHLRGRFAMVLVDRAPAMLRVSEALNPGCLHIEADMRTVRLGRQFDAVFVHDAISYMTSETELLQVMETAFVHCRPGGGALFCPDTVRETFRTSTSHGGHDHGNRGARYLEWTHDPDPDDDVCVADYVYLLRDESGKVWTESDRHVEGLFARATWLRLLQTAGFDARVVPFVHSELDDPLEVFAGRRPARTRR